MHVAAGGYVHLSIVASVSAGSNHTRDATAAFRIKIWDRSANDVVVFDNQMSAADGATLTTLLSKVTGNGAIVIHAK